MSEPCYRVCSLKSLSGHCQLTAGCIYNRFSQELPPVNVGEMIPIKTVVEHLNHITACPSEEKMEECEKQYKAGNDISCKACWEKEVRRWKDEKNI